MPHDVATRIFDVFLLDGEEVIIRLLLKMIKLKQNQIIKKKELDLLQYMRKGMVVECVQEHSLPDLLDD